MSRVRASWLIILVVVLLTLTVKPLRQQATLPLTSGTLFLPGHYDALAERAAKFAKQRYPDDPEMLLGAGLLFIEREASVDLLRQAAEKGNLAAAWAAYYGALREQAPGYMRLGNQGLDPSQPDLVASGKATMQASELPDRLDPMEAQPLLSALQSWAAADPENGLPLALQTDVLYGLHRDQQALELWQAAGSRPQVKGYSRDNSRVVSNLLTRMGIAQPEAFLVAQGSYEIGLYPALRQGARIALYEGKVAQMQGRSADALRWWNGSIALGRHLQDTSDTIIGILVGVAIEGIGASPAWKWYLDSATGMTGGPLYKGRIWYGRDHAFYVSQVGERKDAEVRDSLVRSKVRSQLLRGETKGAMDRFMSGPEMRGVMLVMLGIGAAAVAGLCLILFLALGTWRRAPADAATRLRPTCQLILALAPFGPLAVTAVLVHRMGRSGTESASAGLALACLVLAVATVVFLPLIAAALNRAPEARLKTAWRGNLRRSLPATAAIAMLCFLALNLAAIKPRADWVRQWSDPRMTEMAQVRQRLGAKWDTPPIPKDAWRAEYPKLKTR